MSIDLYDEGLDYAKKLIGEGRYVVDKGDWGEVNPGTQAQNSFIEEHGLHAWSLWHLGVRPDAPRETKEAWAFPYGDYENVHRAGLMAAEERARQYGDESVRLAAGQLLELLDEAAGQ